MALDEKQSEVGFYRSEAKIGITIGSTHVIAQLIRVYLMPDCHAIVVLFVFQSLGLFSVDR